MHWSTGSVMSETRARARAAGLTVNELATLWDLDVPRDLDRLSPPDAEALGVARG